MVKVLCLDGGGVRGLSSLLLLNQVMYTLGWQRNPGAEVVQIPRPCEVFDLIGGTSTGGLIALMLGRLGMTVEECIDAYTELSQFVFETTKLFGGSKFDTKRLEQAIRQILRNRSLDENTLLHDPSLTCKTFVVTVYCQGGAPRILRSCHHQWAQPETCTIVEAALATTAAPTFFDVATIDRDIQLIDGGVGYNNPTTKAIEEAIWFWNCGPTTLLSIGTGISSPPEYVPGTFGITTKIAIAEFMKNLILSSQRVHAETAQRPDVTWGVNYFRLDVEFLGDVGLADWQEMAKLKSYTAQYLGRTDVMWHINQFIGRCLMANV